MKVIMFSYANDLVSVEDISGTYDNASRGTLLDTSTLPLHGSWRCAIEDSNGDAGIVYIDSHDNSCWTATIGNYDKERDFPMRWRPWSREHGDGMSLTLFIPDSATLTVLD